MPFPAKNEQTVQQHKPHPNAGTVSEKAIALKPPAQLHAAAGEGEIPLTEAYGIGPFQAVLQGKMHEDAPVHTLFNPHADNGVTQRVLSVRNEEKDDEWVDSLNADDFETVQHIDKVEFADVQALLKVWISLDHEMPPYDGEHAAITAAVKDIRDSSGVDFGELTGAGFTAVQCRNLYSILGGTLNDIIDQYGGANLKTLFDTIALNGVIALHDGIGDAETFVDLVVSEVDAALVGYIGVLEGEQAGKLISGSSITKFRKLCNAITAPHVNAIKTYAACYALMEWMAPELTALHTNWNNLKRLFAGNDAADEVAQIAALRARGPTMAEIAGFATYTIFNAADLDYMYQRCTNVARLNGILATAVTGYRQDRDQVRAFLNANINVTPLATLEGLLEARVKARPVLTGAEIEKMHTDGTVAITYFNTIQTLQEQQEGGGTHIFRIAWGGIVRSHEIHIHYGKGQNRKTQNTASHIKPSAFSDIRHPISHGFALTLQATIP